MRLIVYYCDKCGKEMYDYVENFTALDNKGEFDGCFYPTLRTYSEICYQCKNKLMEIMLKAYEEMQEVGND